MKTLLILRHAKSSWDDVSLPDYERPLTSRGRRAAKLMSKFILQKKLAPDLILSSTAARARETVEALSPIVRSPTEVRYDARLYLAGVPELLDVISQVEEDRKRVLLIGHNPGLEELVCRLTGETRTMPTAALAKIAIDIDEWGEVGKKRGLLEWLVKPKELASR
jgi:phosphohistidine phosphatase